MREFVRKRVCDRLVACERRDPTPIPMDFCVEAGTPEAYAYRSIVIPVRAAYAVVRSDWRFDL